MPSSLAALDYPLVKDWVAAYAATELGRSVAAEMAPYGEADWARRALTETAELLGLLARGAAPEPPPARDLRPLLRAAHEQGRVFTPEELAQVLALARAAKRLAQAFEALPPGEAPVLRDGVAGMPDLEGVADWLAQIVDPRGQVLDTASARLASLRGRARALERALRERAHALVRARHYRPFLTEERVVVREGRYALPVKVHHLRAVEGVVVGRSGSGQTVFVEPAELVATANEVAALRLKEAQEVRRILAAATHRVLEAEDRLLEALRRLAWYDFTWAKAAWAREWGAQVPELGGKVLLLRDARHPLLLRAERSGGPRVVPLDLRLGEDYDLLVITGPNTGGKTVALKTAGLLSLMALSGLPIPAAPGSRVPCWRGVLADIGDEQSVVHNLSTFSAHMRQIVDILAEATPEHLVLLDELGTGTEPAEGAALARAVLGELVRRGVPTLVSTHLGELKTFAFEVARAENASMAFDPVSLAPQYRLVVGEVGTSNALAVARRLGLPEPLVDEAEARLRSRESGEARLVRELQGIRRAAEERRDAAARALAEAEALQRRTQEEAAAVAARRELLERWAEEEVERILRRVRDGAEPLLRRLRAEGRPAQREAAEALARWLAESLRSAPLGERREAFLRRLKRDSRLRVPRLGVEGRVVKVDRKRRRVGVVVGGLQIEVPFEDILPGGEA